MPEPETDLATDTEAIAARLIAAIEAGDGDAFRACFTEGARIWHNTDDAEQTVDQVARVLAWMHENISGFRYEDVRRQQTASGYVEQHVVRGEAADGTTIAAPACLIVRVDGGRISRIDEYVDPTPFYKG